MNQAEAPIRKSQYGTAITGTELALAMRSLLNTDNDRDTTLMKMRQAVIAYENGINRNMSNALGTPYTPKPLFEQKSANIEGEGLYESIIGGPSGTGNYQQDLEQATPFLDLLFQGY